VGDVSSSVSLGVGVDDVSSSVSLGVGRVGMIIFPAFETLLGNNPGIVLFINAFISV
jgi:hypothetical protein